MSKESPELTDIRTNILRSAEGHCKSHTPLHFSPCTENINVSKIVLHIAVTLNIGEGTCDMLPNWGNETCGRWAAKCTWLLHLPSIREMEQEGIYCPIYTVYSLSVTYFCSLIAVLGYLELSSVCLTH